MSRFCLNHIMNHDLLPPDVAYMMVHHRRRNKWVAVKVKANLVCCVMEWSGQRTGHRQWTQSESETTAGGGGNQVLLYSSRQFSAHPKSSGINKRAAQAARNTCYRYNQISPLDHKMADNCVSLARTNSFLYNN